MAAGLTALGPFFAVTPRRADAALALPWRSLSELTGPSPALRARVESVRATLAERGRRPVSAIEPRVAASAVQLGLAARLTAPALGAAVLGCPLDLRPSRVWWQDGTGSPVPLSVPAAPGAASGAPTDRTQAAGTQAGGAQAGGAQAGGAGPVADWDRVLFDDLLTPLTRAVQELVPVSGRVLWGNVASGINAAARLMAAQRPDLAGAAWSAAARLFARPQLRAERSPPGPAFRRSSCCLFYRLAPGGPSALCGDCVLTVRRVR